MPSPQATERFSERQYNLDKNATRAFDVAYCSANIAQGLRDAYNAVQQQQGIYKNAPHPANPYLRVQTVDATMASPNLYIVTASYAPGTASDKQDKKLEPPTYQWVPGHRTEIADVDVDGNILVNSAGDLFNPGPARQINVLGIIVAKNEKKFPVQTFLEYSNAWNVDTYQIQGFVVYPGQSQLTGITQLSEARFDADYVRIRYSIQFEPGFTQDKQGVWDAFQIRAIDKGRNAWFNTPEGKQVKLAIYNKPAHAGQPPTQVSQEVLLDGTGGVYDPKSYCDKDNSATPTNNPRPPKGATIITPKNGYGAIIQYKGYKSAPFSSLNLFY
jgi:hypothetical protein